MLFRSLAGIRYLGASIGELVDPNTGAMEVSLTQGEALGTVRSLPTGESFRFNTPIAAATTSYAQFYVKLWTNPAGQQVVTFAVRKGTLNIRVLSSPATIAVIDEKALDVPAGAYLTSIRNATEEELRALSGALAIYVADT